METTKITTMQAIVKGLIYADTFVLMHPTRRPPVEKTLSLANVVVPRLGRKGAEDEPFAWEAREFLRERTIGKNVYFNVEYRTKNGRDYGSIYLDEDNEQNVSVDLVREGLATVKPPQNEEFMTREQQALLNAQEYAKQRELGLHGPEKEVKKHVRNVTYDISPKQAEDLVKQWKNKEQKCVVEQVVSGSCVRVITPSHHLVLLNLTGVQSPQINKPQPQQSQQQEQNGSQKQSGSGQQASTSKAPASGNNSNNNNAAPQFDPYKFFTEFNLLQREVDIIFEGSDKFGNFTGSIVMPDGRCYQELLIESGNATVVDWTIAKTKFIAKIRAAEKNAIQKKVGLYKNFKPTQAASGVASGEIQGTVLEVVSGDTLVILTDKGEQRISLASIRAPRFVAPAEGPKPEGQSQAKPQEKAPANGPRKQEQNRKLVEAFAIESREYLRKKVIGKKVRIVVDYERDLPFKREGETVEEKRKFCSVFLGDRNVAVDLVHEGLATVQKHRNEEPRSQNYDLLLEAEHGATQRGRGLHNPKKNPTINFINDISMIRATSAKTYAPLLKRQGRVKGIIAAVTGGGRFRVYLTKDSTLISLALAGLQIPSMGKVVNHKTGERVGTEQFAQEALNFSKANFLQREVDIEVDTTDNVGTFIGYIYMNGEDIAASLVKSGFARTNDRNKSLSALVPLEEAAKSQKIGIWSVEGGVFKKRKTVREDNKMQLADPNQNNFMKVVVTDVLDGSTFYVQTPDNITELKNIEDEINSSNLDSHPNYKPKAGEIVFAKFSADNLWHRAKVAKVDLKKGEASIKYIDYGTNDVVPFDDIRSANNSALANLNKNPAQALECGLAYIYAPALDEAFGDDAASELQSSIWNKELVAKKEYTDGNKLFVTLTDTESKRIINSHLVRQGLARVSKDVKYHPVLGEAKATKNLLEDEQFAREERANLFENGDYSSGSDDEY